MPNLTATRKGSTTREAIIEQAYEMACLGGLESLSIGPVASQVGMSKSGVFAHFGSREDLLLAVLDSAGERFYGAVLMAALPAPRGLARLKAIMSAWLEWSRHHDGGCVLLAAVSEFDDRPGPLRDRVIEQQLRWRQELARAISHAVDNGELDAETAPDLLAFELYSLVLGYHHDAGLFGQPAAMRHAQLALSRLLHGYGAPSP